MRITVCALPVLLGAACQNPETGRPPRQVAEASYRTFDSVDATRRWLEQHPDDHEALLDLAQQLMSPETPAEQRDRRDALDAARRSVQLNNSPNCDYYATLGTALYLNGDNEAAQRAYRSAADLAADSSTKVALLSWADELTVVPQR